MLTTLQKKTSQAIVNIFETGSLWGDYGQVTVLKGDTGHLTYGRSQTTLGSGNLALLIHAYCEAGGLLSDSLRRYLPAFDRRDMRLDRNERVKALLREAGKDPVMKKVQDSFFDRAYWGPALISAERGGLSKPLGITVIYDSWIHGSYPRIRNLTLEQFGKVAGIGEDEWIRAYVKVRRNWLATHPNALLHKTVYRMDSLLDLINKEKWTLTLPVTVRNVPITEELLLREYEPPVLVSAIDSQERVLFWARPLMRGKDVKSLQKALGFKGKDCDGKFGKKTEKAVRGFQRAHHLKVDGKVGPATWAALGL